MDSKLHWDEIYRTKDATQLSWYQHNAVSSVEFIQKTGIALTGRIIDVGGGALMLVDDVVDLGYLNVTILDISEEALNLARKCLGSRGDHVTWLVSDITRSQLPANHYDVWHDRAVFHFLIESSERARYVDAVERSLKPGGHVIVASFAIDGPEHAADYQLLDTIQMGCMPNSEKSFA